MADLQSISNSFSSDFSNSSNFSNSIYHCSSENNNSSSNQPSSSNNHPSNNNRSKNKSSNNNQILNQIVKTCLSTGQQDIIMAQLLLDITGITDASKAAKKLFRHL
ncbi:probable ATP-dependent RNA helicase ddx42 [Dreissena polymorpha]|uniref:Uncharacterized protein n=1 Tax=Dreissena polymorpha TaxID=45954 RepID=A0A9D4MQC4_DREPO|nr:probable ATP-dependent RNA helicase ddx42 [Dreissena polymorpha]KAH3879776.1 hypothetical protein DPMN_003682 [Dreissena polymorpha]